jgi:hydroxypyruvate isomerase
MKDNEFSRRDFLRSSSLLAAGTVAGTLGVTALAAEGEQKPIRVPMDSVAKAATKGNIKHSISKWCYGAIPLGQFCDICKQIGIESIELLRPKDFPTMKEKGMMCAMTHGANLTKGMCNPAYHESSIQALTTGIDASKEYGFPNVVAFSGNAEGITPEDGLKNAVEGFKKIVGHAEKNNVTICIEYLNSKVNHKDYMFDNMLWGVELCKQVGSPNLKILYDIYHAQVMEGDIIRNIQDYNQYIAHYHTAGNPGRHELDENQELYYPAIMRAIVATGYKGYVGHEFEPTNKKDPLASLVQAVQVCDV